MPEFQRARTAEQVAVRRDTILATARRMLAERPVMEISLRELSTEVGLAKSNVLRYFDSREAIFLELLDEEWRGWLDELEAASPPTGTGDVEAWWAGVITETLAGRRLLCDLLSVMASVLERNISLDYARDFKARAAANSARLAALTSAHVPVLDKADAAHFAGAVVVILAGLWPYANPSAVTAEVTRELGARPGDETFEESLREGLTNQLVGLRVRRTGR